MTPIAAGFWGAFFGTAGLMLAVALAAFARSRRGVALMAGLSAIVPAVFVVAYLGWLPMEGGTESRVLAHVAVLSAATLSPLLLSLLGLLRTRAAARRAAILSGALAAAVIGLGWTLDAATALRVSWTITFSVGGLMLVVALRSAAAGNRLGRATVAGMTLLLVALGGLSWIAVDRSAPWSVHALSALAGMGFLAMMGAAAWARLSYLVELSEVLAHGPSYDPVTRMRSHSETGNLIGDLFFNREAEARPVAVIAICLGNLYALENLHGRAAVNHALFVCAGRLRRCVPHTVEMGRLADDGFLLITRSGTDIRALPQLARQLRDRLLRPVVVSTSRDPSRIEASGTAWVADIGIGVLATNTKARPAQAVATVRAMARTAWTYETRIAFFDEERGEITESPTDGGALQPV